MLFSELIILLVSFSFFFIGLLGSFFPIVPGPILSFIGFLLLHFFTPFKLEDPIFWISIISVSVFFVTISDYFFQIIGVKKMGGGKYSIWGVTIGALFGLIFFPTIISIFLGPFLGGFFGSLLDSRDEMKKMKSKKINFLDNFLIGIGAFLGFFSGIFLKFLFSIIVFLVSLIHVIKNWNF